MILSYIIAKRSDRYIALIEFNLGNEPIIKDQSTKDTETVCSGSLSNGLAQSLYHKVSSIIDQAVAEGNEKGSIDVNALEGRIKKLMEESGG